MSSTSISRRQTLQDGTFLVINQATRAMNFPLAQDVARHVRNLVVALKAPKDNDMSARELAKRIENLLDFLDMAAEETESDANISTSTLGYLLELEQLRSNLQSSLSELRGVCELGYPARLASQTRIRCSIQVEKDHLTEAKFGLLMCLTMFTLTTALQNASSLSQAVQGLANACKALHQRQELLEHPADAVPPEWRTDEHRRVLVGYAVPGSQRIFFFYQPVMAPLIQEA